MYQCLPENQHIFRQINVFTDEFAKRVHSEENFWAWSRYLVFKKKSCKQLHVSSTVDFTEFLLKWKKITHIKKSSKQLSIYLGISLVKLLLSRFFFHRRIPVKFRHFQCKFSTLCKVKVLQVPLKVELVTWFKQRCILGILEIWFSSSI